MSRSGTNPYGTRYERPQRLRPGDLVKWAGVSLKETFVGTLGMVIQVMPEALHFRVRVFWPHTRNLNKMFDSHPYDVLERVNR